MKLELKDILKKIEPFIERLKQYKVILFVVGLSLTFGYLILQISSYAQQEPTDDAVAEKLTTVQRPKIDESAINKIEQLKDQNIEVQSLFDQARDNPFSE